MRGLPFLFMHVLCISCLLTASEQQTGKTPNHNNSNHFTTPFLKLKQVIKLPDVKGGFDLMAVDLKTKRLFVSAQDNYSVEVINLQTGKHLLSLPGFNEPKWVVFIPKFNRIYVSTGGDGKVTVLNGDTYKVVKTFSFREGCNNLRFDSATNELFVGVGKTFGSLGIIDLKKNEVTGEIHLSGYAKQFELDGDLIYVNEPQKNQIEVVSRSAKNTIATWPVKESENNVPMSFDRIHHRLFIACEPGKFIIYSTKTGKSIQSITISKGADGIYYDAKRSRIYVSCGAGNIEILHQKDADHYEAMQPIKTVEGAGTSLFSPQLDKLILAVPQVANKKAEMRVYQPVN